MNKTKPNKNNENENEYLSEDSEELINNEKSSLSSLSLSIFRVDFEFKLKLINQIIFLLILSFKI